MFIDEKMSSEHYIRVCLEFIDNPWEAIFLFGEPNDASLVRYLYCILLWESILELEDLEH